MRLIAIEIAHLYESCVQSEYGGKRPVATVALVASLIESVIEDCSFQKAKYVLLQMKKAKFAQINNRATHSAISASSSQSRWSYHRLLDGVGRWTQVGQDFNLLKELGRDDDPVMIKLDDQFHNLKARFSNRGPSGLVYPDATHTEDDISDAESHIPLVMNVTKGRNELVEQNLAVTLMSHLGGGVVSAKVGGFSRESARTKTVRMVIHLLFCLVLAIEVLANTQSVLGLTEGLKESISASAGFEQATSKHEFIDWVRGQVATEFSWRGTQFPLLEPPAILAGGATHYTACDELQQLVTSAARRAAEHSDFDTRIPVIQADTDNECWVNKETHAIGTENTYAPAAYLLTCMQNSAKCTPELEGLNAELSLESKSILVDRMALEVVLLGYKAEPPLIVKVTAQTKFSAVANDVHVRFMHVPDHAGHSATEFVLVILIVCVTLDFIVLACRRGRAFLFDVSRILHLTRIALPCVALRMKFVFEKDLYAYLSSVTWNNAELYQPNASNAGFDVLHQQKDASRLYFIIAMFLAAMTVPSYIGGAKYNIFALLQQTLKTVQGDVKVLAITFFITFCGFVATMYAIMNSLSSLFASPGSTGMIMYGSLFGGAPWNTFLEIRGASRLLSAVGFIAMATYLFLFIIILLNMFVAIILQSYQTQKRDEAVLRAEFIRHLHASEGTSDISTLKASLGERLYEVAEVNEPHRTNFKVTLQRTIKSITERLRTSAKVHHDGSFVSQSTSEIFADEKGEKTSLSRQASVPTKAMPRQDSKIVRKTPPALVKQGSVGVSAQGALPRKLQQLL